MVCPESTISSGSQRADQLRGSRGQKISSERSVQPPRFSASKAPALSGQGVCDDWRLVAEFVRLLPAQFVRPIDRGAKRATRREPQSLAPGVFTHQKKCRRRDLGASLFPGHDFWDVSECVVDAAQRLSESRTADKVVNSLHAESSGSQKIAARTIVLHRFLCS